MRDFRSIVSSAIGSDSPRFERFDAALTSAETHDVNADRFEVDGMPAASRNEARLAGEAYRRAAYEIIPAVATTRVEIVLGDVAIALMRTEYRSFARGRSHSNANQAYALADRWDEFNDRARERVEFLHSRRKRSRSR